MDAIRQVLRRTKTITFDCYGTLIDWRGGLIRSLGEIFGPVATDRANELFRSYVRIEAQIEAEGYRSYRNILSAVVERLARQFDVDLAPRRAALLAEMLPNWPPFADTNEALTRLKQRYRLGVLSNIDRDLFAGTARHFDVAFDFVVTAQDVGAYKPGHAHFERVMRNCLSSYATDFRGQQEDNVNDGAGKVACQVGPTPDRQAGLPGQPHGAEVLHVAQSLFHDGVPAGELGIAYVWINRYKEVNETPVHPVAEYPDLISFAEVACRE